MTSSEVLNLIGIGLQFLGVFGLIVFYLARVRELGDGRLLGKVKRRLVSLRLRLPTPPVSREASDWTDWAEATTDPPPTAEELEALARATEHRAALVGAWSSGSVLAGLLLQFGAAVLA